MTTRYVGIGGNDGNSGLTWALRKLTLNGVEDTPVVAGDVVYAGPGAYRELLTVDVSGGNTYQVGTVTVTNGSTTVTGAGTAFLANVAADYLFHVRIIASGNDGVTNATATFTSAAGNFQAAMIGKVIQIMTKGAYVISAVAAANSITLADPNALGWPAAGGGLTYSVMSNEGHYEISSVTDNNNFELTKPWNGPTLTGLAYLTFNPIRYIADVTGENTDDVGGIVRITGSDNDQTNTRTGCITATSKDYRVFRGFSYDMGTTDLIYTEDCEHWVIEDTVLKENGGTPQIHIKGSGQLAFTIRRGISILDKAAGRQLQFEHSAAVDDSGHVVENFLFTGTYEARQLIIYEVGGITANNCGFIGGTYGIQVAAALNVGQTENVYNCYFVSCGTGVRAAVVGEIIENYNSFYGNAADRNLVGVGAGSLTYPPLITSPLFYDGIKYPWWFSELSEWSQIVRVAGLFPVADDLLGIVRPVTSAKKSWGPVQFSDMERETGTKRTGSASMVLHDAGRHQIWVPVEASNTTIKVYVYREANYAGLLPQMIIKQPGQADDVTTDVGAAGGWNLLTTTLVPAAVPPYVVVELVSRNTAAALAFKVFFDDLDVS